MKEEEMIEKVGKKPKIKLLVRQSDIERWSRFTDNFIENTVEWKQTMQSLILKTASPAINLVIEEGLPSIQSFLDWERNKFGGALN